MRQRSRFTRQLLQGPLAVVALSVLTLLIAPGVAAAATSSERSAFLSMAGKAAKTSQQKYGVPPSVTVAQAILESSWGGSDLARKTKNHFGMKCFKGASGAIAVGCANSPTTECDKEKGCYPTVAVFRVYRSVSDSFADHGYKLYESSRYDPAFGHTGNADQFIREVHKAGYATDPGYSDKIIKLMKQYDLYRFN